MSLPIFIPVSGVTGRILINGYELPASLWWWHEVASSPLSRTIASFPYADVLPGCMQPLGLEAFGVIRSDFNPFLAAGMKAGAFKACRLYLTPTIIADTPSAYIQTWDYKSNSDGLATFNLFMMGDWEFKDWSGTNA